jgi:hypothetical protein
MPKRMVCLLALVLVAATAGQSSAGGCFFGWCRGYGAYPGSAPAPAQFPGVSATGRKMITITRTVQEPVQRQVTRQVPYEFTVIENGVPVVKKGVRTVVETVTETVQRTVTQEVPEDSPEGLDFRVGELKRDLTNLTDRVRPKPPEQERLAIQEQIDQLQKRLRELDKGGSPPRPDGDK